MGPFELQIREFAEKVKAKSDTVLRKVALEMFASIVKRSPVGNPELWAANAQIMTARANYVADANAFNSGNPGRRRRGTSRATVQSKFKLTSGKGYVGGRFRGNWQVGVNHSPSGETGAVDANGGATITAGASEIMQAEFGDTIWFSNNVPYSIPLELGHSKQSPGGMVRLTFVEVDSYINDAIRGTPDA